MFQSIFLLLMIAPVAVMKTGIVYGFFWFLAALYSYYLLKNLSLPNVSYQSLFQKNQRVGAILFLGIFLISNVLSPSLYLLFCIQDCF